MKNRNNINRFNLKIDKMALMNALMFLLVLVPMMSIQAQPQTINFEDDGFSANWFETQNKSNKTIIILGGSEGGSGFGDEWAPSLNQQGYNVLSMSYFGTGVLPKQLELIPLEYLDKAILWLDSTLNDTNNRYGLIGLSKGAELALIQASRIDRFNAVVALAPSSVIWQSINKENYMSQNSSWSLNGEPLPYLSYCYSKGYQNIYNFYDCALDDIDKNAKIQVNNINAPLLLISGGQDKLWPSSRMAKMIVESLKNADHPYEYIHLNYEKAGHLLFYPHKPDNSIFESLGGKPEEFSKISQKVEFKIYEFIKTHL